MKILITGANGFIGKYLKDNLSVEHEVISPTSKELDLTSRTAVNDFFKIHQFDAVIHTAIKGRNNVADIDNQIMVDNVLMFTNLYENRESYKKFINLGSGAEFGLDKSIDQAREEDILLQLPKESYGMAKNVIARIITTTPNFFNLRIFACFDPTESDNRLLKKFKSTVDAGGTFVVDKDRYVDFVSLQDILVVINEVLNNRIIVNDLNVVYPEKYKVSDILKIYCDANSISHSHISVIGTDNKNYTGNGEKLLQCNVRLEGLESALKKYNKES